MSTLTISTNHEIYYSNKEPVPIPELIESLQAIEAIIKRSPKALQELIPGAQIEDVKVYVNEIKSGSLKNNLLVDIIFGGDEEYNKFRKGLCKIRNGNLRDLTDEEVKNMSKLAIALVVAGFVGVGVTLLTAGSNETPSTHIEAYNNTIVNFGAGEFDITGDQFKAIIDSAVGDKKQLAKNTVKLMHPAKADPEANITIDNMDVFTVPPSLIAEVPEKYEEPPKDEKYKDYANADVVIFASDQHNHESGWAGMIPGVIEKRKPIILDRTLKPEKIHGRKRIKADVTVFSRYNKRAKEYMPFEIMLRKVN